MSNRFGRILSSGSPQAAYNQINQNFAKLDAEVTTKQFRGNNGESLLIGKTGDDTFGIKMSSDDSTIELGQLQDGSYGFSFNDGSVTFMTFTKDGIVLNDGTNDRILIGKSTGGF